MARNEPRRACAHAASGGGVAGRMQVTNPSSGVVLLTQNPATDASSLRVSDTSRRVLSATSKLTRRCRGTLVTQAFRGTSVQKTT
jgi:hypothetical protein